MSESIKLRKRIDAMLAKAEAQQRHGQIEVLTQCLAEMDDLEMGLPPDPVESQEAEPVGST